MSDPQTNVEIEDVLTSIRRLVSESEWTRPAAPLQQQNKASEPVAEATQSEPADKFVLTPALRVVEDTPTESTESVSEDVDENATDLERMIAELEAAVHTEQTSFEPEGDEIEDLAATPLSFASVDMAEVPDADLVETVVEQQLAAPVAEMVAEAMAEEFNTDDEHDVESDDPDLGELDENIDDYLTATPQFDETMLRELVTDIVRSELQGALGERITRNVRKLVRREIYRALSSKTYE
ncbi:hypothetical protein BVC71_03340 [Marivivens niveibacter]|uniref:Uncharacterized protein n=1 Tax=Marivivens niveibacter TaxID=1930667 RepID=A0A251X1Q6_9RHOB|nr:hypothetical protein [Marivivens niveibacter]OUD10542.1 hypothetical protein BVC71_03340 [Marivivens niveibacter]